jgi:hypothetical protein
MSIDYYSRPEISNSDITHLLNGYDFFEEYKKNPPSDTDTLEVGRLFHSVILEGYGEYCNDEPILQKIAEEKGKKKVTRGVDEYKEWKKKYNGVILKEETFLALEYYKEYFKNSGIYSGGHVEKEIIFDLNGVKCRSKLDYCNSQNNTCRDLKTSQKELTKRNIINTIWTRHYYRQVMFYSRAFAMEYGEVPEFTLDFISLVRPFKHVEVRIENEAMLKAAKEEIDLGLNIFKNKTVFKEYVV